MVGIAAAADIFIRVQNSKLHPELARKIIGSPESDFTVSPHRICVFAKELPKLGVLRNKAASWKEHFFEETQAPSGS